MKDFEIRCDESHLENNHTLYGKFTLGPFLPGQGTTFGNALRRSLLSELPGLAITAFEILGVRQEFSTLPGLRESILDLSLNLKQVVLTGVLPRSTPPIGFLKVRGPAQIHAVDLQLPPGICCTFNDQYIATLADNGILSFKFIVSVGKGYSIQPYSLYRSLSKVKLQPTSVSASLSTTGSIDKTTKTVSSPLERSSKGATGLIDNKSSLLNRPTFDDGNNQIQKFIFPDSTAENNDIQKLHFQRVTPHQVLPIDAVFTPVRKVNFLTQVNDRLETARENIVLEIWTNGSIHPKRALEDAALSLVHNFDGLLKNIQQASSFSKGMRYGNNLNSHKENRISSTVANDYPINDNNFKEDRRKDVVATQSLRAEQKMGGNFAKESDASGVNEFAIDVNSVRSKEDKVDTTKQPDRSDLRAGFTRSVNRVDTAADSKDKEVNRIMADKLTGGENTINKDIPINSSRTALWKLDDENNKLTLHKAVYNLDIGNLDISLQTYIFLKRAKINTLAHLLAVLSGENSVNLNERAISELNRVVNQLGLNLGNQ